MAHPSERGPEPPKPARRDLPSIALALAAGAALVGLSFLGSRGFKDLDVALIGYFVALAVATSAIAYRYALWVTRPPTWRYFRAGWANFFSLRNFLRYTAFLPKAIWTDLIGQTFLLRRGLGRWFAHQAIFWGVVGSLLITVPLTLGWIRFSLVPPSHYQLWFFGLPVLQFAIEAGTGFALFHALDWTAFLLIVGVGMALWRRVTDVGLLTTQRFGFDLMPLVLLLAIAVTGLLLTVSSMWWNGRYYWFISLSHQVIVVAWLLSIPFGKFFHIAQRPASIGVKLYQTVNQDIESEVGQCRGCGEALPSQQFVADLQANTAELGMNFELGGDRGWLQEYCPTCKRTMRGEAYFRMMGKRFL